MTKVYGKIAVGMKRGIIGLVLLVLAMANTSFAQSIVTVRTVEEGTVNRVVFYISSETTYEANQIDNQFSLTFPSQLDFDFGSFSISPLPNVSEPSYSFVDGTSVVQLNVVEGSIVNHYRQGARLFVEVSLPEANEGETQTAQETPPAQEPTTDVAQTTEQDTQAPSGDVLQNQLDGVGDFVEQQNEADAQPEPVADAQEQQEEQPQGEAPVRQIRPTDIGLGEVLEISMQDNGNEQLLVFNWRFPVGAAVFKRAGFLWVIFDEESSTDLVAVQPFLNDRILSAEQARDLDQTLFRFQLKEGQGVSTLRQENSWVVVISDEQTTPAIPISLARQESIGDNFRIFVPLDNPGPHLRIQDPVVGDVIDVIPVFDGGMGSARARNFAQFEILPSAQGLLLKRTSDQVVVSRFSNGVAIGGVTNLAVSLSPLATDLALRGKNFEDELRPARLIDFEVWRLGGLKEFSDNRIDLFKQLSEADEETVNEKRWDTARFYLGHDMYTEAFAFLNLMADKDPEIVVDPKYRAVRGVSLYYLGRYDEAWRQLSARELDAEPTVFLWRALVAHKQERDFDTLELFERGRESIEYYEDARANEFRIAVVEAALNIEHYDTASWQLSQLRRTEMSPVQKADVDYLEGRLLMLMGESEEAMNYFQAVDEFVNRRAAAYARYDMTISRFERGIITPDEAIVEMERLRFSWRGDLFEQRLLHGLGNLYLEKDDYRLGLETLRQAVASFDENSETREMTSEMVAAYRDLFLDGEAEEMPAVQALALYYDFRELTPLGAEGDQMIRRLADRLVSVDLLERAAALLDHQVRFRLSGAAQSIIASRLAKIYLLDHKPEKALEILRATRQNTFPQDVLDERNLVEARVLTELGRYQEGEVLISGLEGLEAQQLRADIYWGSEDWERVASSISEIMENRWQSDEPLTDDERQYLIRKVIALSLLDRRDDLDLAKSRYERLMQQGLLANAFDVITNPENSTTEELRDVVRRTASVSTLKSFMDSYRSEFISGDGPNS